MPATVLAERVGWPGSIRWFRDNVNRVRAQQRPPDPADRLTWAAGDAGQCDLWFPPRKIALEDGTSTLLPVLVVSAAYSRFTLGRMIPTRKTEDLLLGTWALLQRLGRVPRPVDLGQRAGHRARCPPRGRRRRVHGHAGRPAGAAQTQRPGIEGAGGAA